jgi:hypothetical protein
VWVPSLRASAALAAVLDVAARFDSPSLLPRLFLLRATKCYPLLGQGRISRGLMSEEPVRIGSPEDAPTDGGALP